MRKGFLIYEEMRKCLTIYEEAFFNRFLPNFLIYEENFILFFISVGRKILNSQNVVPSLPWDRRRPVLPWDSGRVCRACRAGPRSRAVPPRLSGREGRAAPVFQAAPCLPAALGNTQVY